MEKREMNLQRPGEKYGTDAKLGSHRHLQVPDHVDWYTQHCDVRDHVEARGGEIEVVYCQAVAINLGRPYLPSRAAEKYRYEEEHGVEDLV